MFVDSGLFFLLVIVTFLLLLMKEEGEKGRNGTVLLCDRAHMCYHNPLVVQAFSPSSFSCTITTTTVTVISCHNASTGFKRSTFLLRGEGQRDRKCM